MALFAQCRPLQCVLHVNLHVTSPNADMSMPHHPHTVFKLSGFSTKASFVPSPCRTQPRVRSVAPLLASPHIQRKGFCLTGAATHSPKKSSVCLCPGGLGPQTPSSTSRRSTASSKSPSKPSKATTPSTRRSGAGAAGSLWYTSDREVPRGFQCSVAFRCDRPKRNPGNAAPRQDIGGQAGATGSLSFLVHQHRSALSGDEENCVGGVVPNSLSVRLEPDGEGGGQVSIR